MERIKNNIKKVRTFSGNEKKKKNLKTTETTHSIHTNDGIKNYPAERLLLLRIHVNRDHIPTRNIDIFSIQDHQPSKHIVRTTLTLREP
jgi:hypothetical protein